MLDQPPHKNGRNFDSSIPKAYEFVSDSQSVADVDGTATQPFSNDWDEKFQLDKGDSKMDSDCRFLVKQKDMSTESRLHGHTDVSCRNNLKTLNRCSDMLSTDEALEAAVGRQEPDQEPSRSSIRKDVDLSDFSDAATSDANEDIKSAIEQNVYWKGESSRNNSSSVKKPSFTSCPVVFSTLYSQAAPKGSVCCIHTNAINSELEETQKDDNVVLYSGIFTNESSLKMKAHQTDDKKYPLLLQNDSSVDYISLESPGNLYSFAAEDQQKQVLSLIGPERCVRSSSMDSDILPLNDFDSAEELFPVHASLYNNSQSMQGSSQLSSAAPATFNDSMSQEGKASDIADSTENVISTDSGYFSTACDLLSSEDPNSIEPDDSSEQHEQIGNYPERDSVNRQYKCNLKLGNANLTATTTLSSSLILSPGGSSTSNDGNAASQPQSTDHPLSMGEKLQQESLLFQYNPKWSVDAVEMERNSADCIYALDVGRNSGDFMITFEMGRNSADFTDAVEMGKINADFTDNSNCTVSDISCLPLLSQAVDSSPACFYSHDNHEPQAEGRHIKSILNTYVSHKLKTEAGNDCINDIADEFALILNDSRKRSATNKDPSAIPVKKPYLMETNSTSNSKKQCASLKGKDDSNCAWARIKAKHKMQKQDAALVLCSICDTSSPSAKTTHCKNAHAICQTCLEDHVRLVMASNQVHLSCPNTSCSAVIPLDSLSPVLPSLVIDILSDNFRMKERKATAKAVKKMQELVICPRCACPGMLDEWTIQFVCATCNYDSCRYCKAAWARYDEHDGCFLLNFVGMECLQNIAKVPRNWDTNLTPFNKNYLQVNIRLDSTEGSTVAAFFEKTAAFGTHVVQVFRIQNRKLWEKYVLKRKHIEEDIGTAELKEKFLFHGTKAENIVSICSEGFDIRVPTANGAVLGKGIYFSTTARYSEKYVDDSKMMYLARVLCGWSQQGQKLLTRPSYHSKVRRMYDSCVNDLDNPTIFTIFDNSQCYPEYLIQFGNNSPANTRK